MSYRYFAALVIPALCLAGCGGSGSGPSPASYRASVNKICATYNAKITALPTGAQNTLSGLDEAEGDATTGLRQIKTMKPPSSMSSSIDRWVGSLTESETDARNALAALRTGNDAQAKSFATEGSALNTRDNAEATSLGLPSCAQDPQPSGS